MTEDPRAPGLRSALPPLVCAVSSGVPILPVEAGFVGLLPNASPPLLSYTSYPEAQLYGRPVEFDQVIL